MKSEFLLAGPWQQLLQRICEVTSQEKVLNCQVNGDTTPICILTNERYEETTVFFFPEVLREVVIHCYHI